MTGVALPGAPRPTSAVGMGCAALTGGSSLGTSVRLVHAAFEAGIRHFDVAPPYGLGTAEDALGAALADRRDQVTIATKLGIARPANAGLLVMARTLASPLRRLAPGLARQAGARAYTAARAPGQFAVPQMAASLTESLRRLRTERVDLLLLHEVRADELTDAAVIFLEEARRAGRVGAIGTATSASEAAAIRQRFGGVFDVWQTGWAACDAADPPAGFAILHGSVGRALGPLQQRWTERPADLQGMAERTGFDLADPAILSQVLLGAARAHNPDGIVLTASRSAGRLAANARALRDPRMAEAGAILHAALAEARAQSSRGASGSASSKSSMPGEASTASVTSRPPSRTRPIAETTATRRQPPSSPCSTGAPDAP